VKPDYELPRIPAYSVVDPSQDPGRPVVRLLNLILSEGILLGASQIRFASDPEKCRVAFYKDSWLDVMALPAIAARPLLDRIRAKVSLETAQGPGSTGGDLRVAGEGRELNLRVTVSEQGNNLEEVLLQLSNAAA